MKVWQLHSILAGNQELCASIASVRPEWAQFHEWFNRIDQIITSQDRAKLDFELPPEFVRQVLAQSERDFFSPKALASCHARPAR